MRSVQASSETAAQATSGRLAWALALVAATAYLALVAWSASRLTLFWDDYDAVLAIAKDPIGSLFVGTNSHFGPGGGVLFQLALRVFGPWYPGYVLVNAVLGLAAAFLAARTAERLIGARRWIPWVAVIAYLTSVGMAAQMAIAACISWYAALLLAMLAAHAVAHGRSPWTATGWLAASWITWTGLAIFGAALCFAVLAVAASRRREPEASEEGGTRSWSGVIRWGVLWGVLAIAATLMGTIVARLNPTDYYVPVVQAAGFVPMTSDPASAITLAMALTVAYLAAPLTVVGLSSGSAVTTLTFAALDRLPLAVLAIVSLVAAASWLEWRASAGSRLALRTLLAPLLLALPVAAWAMMIAVARGSNGFAVRYQMVWLLAVALFWAVLLCVSPASRLLQWLRWTLVAVVTMTAITGLLRFPVSLTLGADQDRPRTALSAEQRERMEACSGGVLPVPVEEISPSTTPEAFCRAVEYLRDYSLAGLLGVRS